MTATPEPISFGPRVCWFCDRPLAAVPVGDETQEHCPSPGCHWCRDCEHRRVPRKSA